MRQALLGAGIAGICLLWVLAATAMAQTHAGEGKAWLEAGRQAMTEGDLDQAERDFRLALQRGSEAAAACTGLGEVAMHRGQWQQALDWLDQSRQKNPRDPATWLDRGLVYCNLHQFDQGLANFRQLLRLRPQSRQGRYLAGVTALYTGDSKAALAYLLPLQDHPPNHLEYYYDLSTAAQMEDRNGLSQTVLKQLIEHDDGSPAYHLLLGRAYLNHNQPEMALPQLQQVMAAAPNLPLLHFTVGIAYQDLHQYAQARTEFQRDLAIAPDNALDLQRMGEIDSQLHQDRQARADDLRAVTLTPGLAIAQLELGTVDLRLEQFAEAQRALRMAIRLYPQGAQAHYMLGRVLQRLHRKDEAQREFATATRLEQQNQGRLRQNFAGGILTPAEGARPDARPEP